MTHSAAVSSLDDVDVPDVPFGFYRCAEDGRLLTANTAFAHLMGYDSVARLQQQNLNLDRAWYVDPAQRAALRSELRRRQSVLDRIVEVHRPARGDRLWVLEDARQRRLAGGLVVEGFVRDVSKQRAEQERLRRQAERFRAFDGLIRAWYWEADHEHRFTYVSPSAEAVVTLPRERFLGRRPWEMMPEHARPKWAAHRRDVEARRPFTDFAHTALAGDTEIALVSSGHPVYDDDGGFRGYRGVTRPADLAPTSDIATAAGEPVRDLVASSSIAMLIHRGDGVLMANQALAELLDYPDPVTLIARHGSVFDLYVAEERDRLREFSHRRLHGLSTPKRYETRMAKADGSVAWVIGIATVLQWQGEPAVLGAMVDITSYKRGEDELRAAIEEAERASRAKSDFLAAMSHELRTPLNAIMGFSEVIENELLGPVGTELYSDYAGDIHRSGRHLLSLISDLLDIARIEAGRLELHEEHIVVPELINEVTALVRKDADTKGVRLCERIDDRLPLLYADRRAARQMLLNLLANAIKFTPAGGQVGVDASCRDACLSLEVRDTGVGVAPEELPKILTLFGQAENARIASEGTGLGLPITKSLIEQHGGRLDIETALGQGMCATLVFPAERVRRASL